MEQMDVFSDRSGAFYALIRWSGATLTRSLWHPTPLSA
jgi:hypothetical protein